MTNEQIAYILLFITSLIAVVLAFCVVFRVERKLDLSFKFIVISLLFFSVGVVFDIFRLFDLEISLSNYLFLNYLCRCFFIIFMAMGLYKMNALITDINEETIKKENKKKQNFNNQDKNN